MQETAPEVVIPEVVDHGSQELRARLLRQITTRQPITTPLLKEKVEAHIAIHGIPRHPRPSSPEPESPIQAAIDV